MPTRFRTVLIAALAALATAAFAHAATFNGKSVDDKWYEGRAVSTAYGGYRCQIKFHGDRVFFKLNGSGQQIVGMLDDEVITDPHEIVVDDPKRGGYWTLDVYNLGR